MPKSKFLRSALWQPTTILPYGSPEAKANRLGQFPLVFAVGLHYITLGLFTWIWLNLMHGSMPKLRRDDPSGLRAILFHFIPFFNLYWLFFSQIRLCDRINEQRVMREMPKKRLKGMAIAVNVAVLSSVAWPEVRVFVFAIIMPIYLCLVQRAVNDLAIITYMGNLADVPSDEGNKEE
ncbi:MAG TPA: hypothetical protein VM219_04420 [Phycisphaerae bacterium]|nr:hypothetical protein [Phycisphaerae bacterium]